MNVSQAFCLTERYAQLTRLLRSNESTTESQPLCVCHDTIGCGSPGSHASIDRTTEHLPS